MDHKTALTGPAFSSLKIFMTSKLVKNWRVNLNKLLAREIGQQTQYYDQISYIAQRSNDSKLLYECLGHSKKELLNRVEELSPISESEMRAIILNGNFNYDNDIQHTLLETKTYLNRLSRLIVVLYNPYYSSLFGLLNRIGIIAGNGPKTFITMVDLQELAKLAGYEITRVRTSLIFPFTLFGFGTLLNILLSKLPLLNHFCAVGIYTLRPILKSSIPPKLSIVIPARNEAGNIENAIKRLPILPVAPQVIFIEGNSSDNTWEEIQRIQKIYQGQHEIIIGQQTGKGKSNAVDKGFELATGDLLTILDADLTMPPEKLKLFYDAYVDGTGDFINGSRLLYEMEGQAMKPLNKLGNIFFAKSLGLVLETRLADSLCGTKLFPRPYLSKFLAWKKDFGNYDPFGDYNMIFPACALGIGLQNLHIRYLDRTYGQTNISRFSDGFKLLRMTFVAFLKIKLGFGVRA